MKHLISLASIAAMCSLLLLSCSESYAQAPGQPGGAGMFDRGQQQQQQQVQIVQPRPTFVVIYPRYVNPALLAMLFGGDVIYDDASGGNGGYGNGNGNGGNGGWGNGSGNDSGRGGGGYGSSSGGRRGSSGNRGERR